MPTFADMLENVLREVVRSIAYVALIAFVVSSVSMLAPSVAAAVLSQDLVRHYPDAFMVQMGFWAMTILLTCTSLIFAPAPGLEQFVRDYLARPALRLSTHMFAISSGFLFGWYIEEAWLSKNAMTVKTSMQVAYICIMYFSFAFNTALLEKLIADIYPVYQKRYGELIAPISFLVALVLGLLVTLYVMPHLRLEAGG